jgi:ribosome recycling factor
VSAIRELEHDISDLILAGSTRTTLSDLAALAILDSHTLAVVPFADRDRDRLGQTIAERALGAREIRATGSVITITI